MSGSPEYADEEEDIVVPAPKVKKTRTTAVKRPGGKVAMTGKPDTSLADADPLSPKVLKVSPELQDALEESVTAYKSLGTRVPIYGKSPIYPFQYAVAGTFAKSKGITKLFMDKGVGKTIMAFEAAAQITDRGGLCLIAVPTQTRKTWRGQGMEAKLIDKDPLKTKFFIFDPEQKEHYAYLTNRDNFTALSDRAKRTGLVIIAKDASLLIKQGGNLQGAVGLLSKVGAGLPLSIIVDEGHTPKRQVDIIRAGYSDDGEKSKHDLNIARMLYMAGSRTKLKTDHFIDCFLTAYAPIAEWHIEMLTGRQAAQTHEQRLKEIFRDNRHVIVSSGADEWISIKDLIPNKHTVRKTVSRDQYMVVGPGQANPEANFANDESKTVYYLSPVQGKGMNLLADALVINSVEGFIIDSLIQLSYRPLRPNNEWPIVKIYVFVRSQEEYYKAYYASAFSYNGWTQGYDAQANPQFVSKALVLPRAMQCFPEKLGTVDRCTILANYIGMEVSNDEDEEGDNQKVRLIRYMTKWRATHLAKLNETTIFSGDNEGTELMYYE